MNRGPPHKRRRPAPKLASPSPRRLRLSLLTSSIWALIVICIAFSVTMVRVSSQRPLTALEATLLQFVILSAGVTASYLFARRSATHAARDIVKAHARSAFRRVVSLYSSLSRLSVRIQRLRSQEASEGHALDVIEAIVREQIPTGADALEDWRDIVPDDVADVENRLREQQVEDLRR